MVNNVMLH